MRSLATLSVTALVALAGCGGDDSSDSSGSSGSATTATTRGYSDDATQISQVFDDYFATLATGDGEKACGFFSDDAVKKIESAAAGKSCGEAVDAGLKITGTDAYKTAAAEEPQVSGDTATVTYQIEVKGQKVETDQKLVKQDGEWKLEAAEPPSQ
jgi:hypothetical protein